MNYSTIVCVFVWAAILCGAFVWLRKALRPFTQLIRYRLGWETFFTFLLAASVLAAVVLVIGIQCFENNVGFLEALLHALRLVFQVLEGNSKEFLALSDFHPIAYLLAVAVPVLTAGTVFVFLTQHMPRPIPWAKEYCIFSQLDEHSILLAKDIQHRDPSDKRVFLFLRTRYAQQDADTCLRLKDLRYRFYPHTEADLLTFRWSLRFKKLHLYFLSDNTDMNFDRLKRFLQTVERKKLFRRNLMPWANQDSPGEYQQELYLLSETSSAPMLIDDLREMLCDTKPGVEKRRKPSLSDVL